MVVIENSCIFIRISPKYVSKAQTDNESALVWIMAWRLKRDKPLSEPTLTLFLGAYMRQSVSMSYMECCEYHCHPEWLHVSSILQL